MSTRISRPFRSTAWSALLLLGLTAVAAPALADPGDGATPLTPAASARYIGTYLVTGPQGDRATYRVSLGRDGLIFERRGDEGLRARLIHEGSHVFHLETHPQVKVTFLVSGSHPTRMVVGVGEPEPAAPACELPEPAHPFRI